MTIVLPATTDREQLLDRFRDRIQHNPDLARRLVSYQANKEIPFYRWFKYREGFTAQLVNYLLEKVHPLPGILLDPFAGSGAALFGAVSLGWSAKGIELLPVGIHAMYARFAANNIDPVVFVETTRKLCSMDFTSYYDETHQIHHIAITKGAFPQETEQELVGYISYCNKHINDDNIRQLALFAAFCILEDISYTRKDGQYLRWDARSGRSQGKKAFDKGKILTFKEAVQGKLEQMRSDLLNMPTTRLSSGQIKLNFDNFQSSNEIPDVVQGSCLEILPTIQKDSIDVILTSPPYCNRYDYTRTYALELVHLGETHKDVTGLRQEMLSCTVENKNKVERMRMFYTNLKRDCDFNRIEQVFRDQYALHEVLAILDELRDNNQLNNPHISRMVRNYFYEMCFVVYEMSRILAPNGHVIMVNDNVRYAGEEVPVDIILSSIAEAFGLVIEKIWTLGRGKGNSSQQMGVHGRTETRKCVYIWRKPTK